MKLRGGTKDRATREERKKARPPATPSDQLFQKPFLLISAEQEGWSWGQGGHPGDSGWSGKLLRQAEEMRLGTELSVACILYQLTGMAEIPPLNSFLGVKEQSPVKTL